MQPQPGVGDREAGVLTQLLGEIELPRLEPAGRLGCLCHGRALWLNAPAKHDRGGFAVEDADGHARVVWESSFVPVDPAMAEQVAQMWEPFLTIVLSNLKRLVEGR